MEIAEIIVHDDDSDDEISLTLLSGNPSYREYVVEVAVNDSDGDANTSSESDNSILEYHLIDAEDEFSDFVAASQLVEEDPGTALAAQEDEVEENEVPEGAAQRNAQTKKSCSIPPLSEEKINLIKKSMQQLNLKPPSLGAASVADKLLLAHCRAARIGDGILNTDTNNTINL